ncbi:signal recognition particle protein Srp19 [Candidatus Bathyarchaeota archaeon A05DMB-2]|jgi:signal recognition particle subunit SRP19|nr:signal recognition particle protein Srp19 [Candidatus Bathyarchaeota archaeon A05DMB-2]
MRKQDKAIIWPAYFDQAKSRGEGRRVPKSLAVPSPKIDEVTEAARKLGLEHEVRSEVGYPKTPWLKTGMLLVEKKEPKEQIIKKIAKQLLKIRSQSQKPQ